LSPDIVEIVVPFTVKVTPERGFCSLAEITVPAMLKFCWASDVFMLMREIRKHKIIFILIIFDWLKNCIDYFG
jgi:hypothetical protein